MLFIVYSQTAMSENSSLKADLQEREFSSCMMCHRSISKSDHSFVRDTKVRYLPNQFTLSWRIIDSPTTSRPPYSHPPAHANIGLGKTYYDWKKRAVAEEYYNFCIPLFPAGNHFRCKFLGIEDKAYLIKYSQKNKLSCCVFMQPLGPPHPDFIKNLKPISYLSKSTIEWHHITTPYSGAFGYGFKHANGQPAAFWFQSINGWVQQDFYGFEARITDPTAFQKPRVCYQAKPC